MLAITIESTIRGFVFALTISFLAGVMVGVFVLWINSRRMKGAAPVSGQSSMEFTLLSLLSRVKHMLESRQPAAKILLDVAESGQGFPRNSDTWKQIRNGLDQQLEEIASVPDRITSVTRLGLPGQIRPIEQVDLVELLRDLRRDLTPLAAENKVRLVEVKRNDADPLSPTESAYIDGDRLAIKEIFYNLLANAAKHSGEGTEVLSKITRQSDRWFQIRISDNGSGIPIDILDQIFEPGSRFYGPGSEPRGTGMGLHLCKLLVELHGGRISAKENEPHGVEFVVTLPVTAPRFLRQ